MLLLSGVCFQACNTIVGGLKTYVKSIRSSLDGRNVVICLTELGTRFHRLVYEHILSFQYNSVGEWIFISCIYLERKIIFNILSHYWCCKELCILFKIN